MLQRIRASAFLLAAVCIWGSSIAIVKYFLSNQHKLEPLYLFVRFLIGTIVLYAYMRWWEIPLRWPRPFFQVVSGLLLGMGFLLQTDYLADPDTSSIDAAFLSV